MIKLSIIIPMFNVSKYLQKCINSAYKQGFIDSEFELILVDDESPDDSLSVANNEAKDHCNISIISQKNKGLGGARNTGILHAKGKYLLFLDADDYLLPNALKEIVNIALQKELDILEFGAQGVLPNGEITYQISKSSNQNIYNGILYYNKIKYMNSACNKLYKRELLLETQIYFLERIYIEDFEFNTRVFFYAKNVMAVNNVVAHYLQSTDSITRNTSKEKKEKMLEDLISVLRYTKLFKEKTDIMKESQDIRKYFGTRMSFLNITIFYQLYKNKSSYKRIKQIKDKLENERLFQINCAVSEKSKDFFRILILNNMWLFKVIQPIQKIIF